MTSAINPESINVPPVPQPPTSHHLSANGHQLGASGLMPQRMPSRIITRLKPTDNSIRGHDATLSAAVFSAALRTRSKRRSAHLYCVARSAIPAKISSRPGPGNTSAATPAANSTHPKLSKTIRFPFLLTKSMSVLYPNDEERMLTIK